MQNQEDLYSDGSSDPAPATPSGVEGDDKPSEGADDSNEGKTFVVPEEVCPGMKPGDKMEATVTRVNEGSYEMKYEPKEESQEEAPPEAAAPPEGSMASMME